MAAVVFEDGAARVTVGGRTAVVSISTEADGPCVALDSILAWEPPHADAPLDIAEIGAIVRALEAAYDAAGIDVTFD